MQTNAFNKHYWPIGRLESTQYFMADDMLGPTSLNRVRRWIIESAGDFRWRRMVGLHRLLGVGYVLRDAKEVSIVVERSVWLATCEFW